MQRILLSLFVLFAGWAQAQDADPLVVEATAADATKAPAHDWEAQRTALEKHFPNGLVDATGAKVELETLRGKVVGIYFSAAWCGPCRRFSPTLFQTRNKYKDDFQVVFVSSDRTEAAQRDYMKKTKMECPTLKFGDAARNALSQTYQVRSIPTLVLLDHHGQFFSRDGRTMVSQGLDMSKITAGKIRIEKEEYLCGKCDKVHTRNKIVYDDDE